MPARSKRIYRSESPRRITGSLTVVQAQRAESNTSRQTAFTDEFLTMAANAATIVIPPPYNVELLFSMIEKSNMLRQCIDAYVTNTVGTGWEIDAAGRGREMNAGEQDELQSFIEYANTDESLTSVMKRVMRDRESVGFGFHEIIRDITGNIALLRYCPAAFTRLCGKDETEIKVTVRIMRGRRVSEITEYRRFRRYVQIVNGRQTFFKEYGDPRRMDYETGAFEGQDGFDPKRVATEIYHWRLPSNESYGVPRWINQLPSIIGSREAEEVNMRYFEDNTVPPMMLLVGGGRLTKASYQELTKALNTSAVGKERQNRIMLLEAVGEGDSFDKNGSPIDLKVERLADSRQSDGLFSKYDDSNMAKVRSSFRLPPITVGMSQDVNFATASTSAFVAESQVFAPARDEIDEVLNMKFVWGSAGLKLTTVKLVSRTPSITSPEMVIKTMTALNVMGALTPRMAQEMANKVLQSEITPYPKKGQEGWEEWMDKPIVFASIDAAADARNADGINPDTGEPVESQEGQAIKDPETKKVEKTGNVGAKRPKNGQQ